MHINKVPRTLLSVLAALSFGTVFIGVNTMITAQSGDGGGDGGDGGDSGNWGIEADWTQCSSSTGMCCFYIVTDETNDDNEGFKCDNIGWNEDPHAINDGYDYFIDTCDQAGSANGYGWVWTIEECEADIAELTSGSNSSWHPSAGTSSSSVNTRQDPTIPSECYDFFDYNFDGIIDELELNDCITDLFGMGFDSSSSDAFTSSSSFSSDPPSSSSEESSSSFTSTSLSSVSSDDSSESSQSSVGPSTSASSSLPNITEPRCYTEQDCPGNDICTTAFGDCLAHPSCKPGQVCAFPCQGVCEFRPECNDGRDNDNDGLTDYPSDTGCTSRTDNDEEDGFISTPECSDTFDNDFDGLIDFPDDPGCLSDKDDNEHNAPVTSGGNGSTDPTNDGSNTGPSTAPPNTPSRTDFLQPQGPSRPKEKVCWDFKDDDEDGLPDSSDPDCRGSDFPGYDIFAEESECNDGEDNDKDGAIDYPADFSCTSAYDPNEAEPRAACQDERDNDGDGAVDLEDKGCASQQDNREHEGDAENITELPPSTPQRDDQTTTDTFERVCYDASGTLQSDPRACAPDQEKIKKLLEERGVVPEVVKAPDPKTVRPDPSFDAIPADVKPVKDLTAEKQKEVETAMEERFAAQQKRDKKREQFLARLSESSDKLTNLRRHVDFSADGDRYVQESIAWIQNRQAVFSTQAPTKTQMQETIAGVQEVLQQVQTLMQQEQTALASVPQVSEIIVKTENLLNKFYNVFLVISQAGIQIDVEAYKAYNEANTKLSDVKAACLQDNDQCDDLTGVIAEIERMTVPLKAAVESAPTSVQAQVQEVMAN